MAIDEVRSRLASIQARFEPRPPAQQATFADADSDAFVRALSRQSVRGSGLSPGLGLSSALPGTLGQMWQAAAGRTATAPWNGSFNQGGRVPAGAAQYGPAFQAAGARYGVDPDLLAAVAWTESAFNPAAVSQAGALGLMQIMPGTASGLGVDPLDPVQAIDGAARYLRAQLDRFGDPRLALAAYNAGPGAVEKYGGIPPYPETTAYVAKVTGRYQQLRSTP